MDTATRRALVALAGFFYVSFLYQFGLGLIDHVNLDFPSFYFGAQLAFGDGGSAYDHAALLRAATTAGLEQEIYPFLYPPPSLLVFYPFTFLSYQAAKVTMLVLNHGLLAGVALLLFFRILRLQELPPLLGFAIAYLLSYRPLVLILLHGQVNLIALAALVAAWHADRNPRRDVQVAAPLSIAALVKSTPLVFVVYFLVRRRFRLIVWTAGLLGAYAAIAAAALPGQVWTDWLATVAPSGGYGSTPRNLFSPAAPWNQSLNGFVARLFEPNQFTSVPFPSPGIGGWIAYALALALAAFTFGAMLRARRRAAKVPESARDIEWALVLTLMCLVSPLAWEHHLTFALPAAIIAMREIVYRPSPVSPLVGLAVFVLAWTIPVDRFAAIGGLAVLGISTKFFALSLIWLFLLVTYVRTTRPARLSPQS